MKVLEPLMDGSRVLIFCATKRNCDELTRMLRMDGFPALALHGDKAQSERDWVLSEFRYAFGGGGGVCIFFDSRALIVLSLSLFSVFFFLSLSYPRFVFCNVITVPDVHH
jgi:helicase-like protein